MFKFLKRLFQTTPAQTQSECEPGWELIDPRPTMEQNPYTFFVPSNAEKAALQPGDLVKMMFDGLDEGVERMWVIFEGRDDQGCYGKLDNEPCAITGLNLHDPVRFQDFHITAVYQNRCTSDEDLAAEEKFFERCHVDPEILSGEAQISKAERHPPKENEDQRFPDAGWVIHADGREDLPLDKMSYVAIGVVLNRDDSLLELLDEPVGTVVKRTKHGLLLA